MNHAAHAATCFVLVRPEVPENLGAAARALNTMGFADLRLVGDCGADRDKARWVAHGSTHILDAARRFNDLSAAVADCDLVVGTTARRRNRTADYLSPPALATVIAAKASPTTPRTAIVFGPESSGLSNDDIALCNLVSTVPLATQHPSLNLGQAVMLYAYELSLSRDRPSAQDTERNADCEPVPSTKVLLAAAATWFERIGVHTDTNIGRRLLQRLALLGADDSGLALFVLRKTRQLLGRAAAMPQDPTI